MSSILDVQKNRALVLLSLIFLGVPGAVAEVIFDGTFGHTDLRTGNFLITESDGQLSANGANLFQSFDTFNVNLGETATFTFDSASVQTIIGRVTGTNQSIIDGTIASDANLWIANPNGVLIGATAIFDGSGLIRVEAGDTINFADGSEFRARSLDTSSLSIAAPASFGFLSARLDGSLGGVSKDVISSAAGAATLTAADGVQDGNNLFYSFDLFSLYPSQSLEFNAAGIDNLIVFSDGIETSMINSTIKINDPVTNFWFLNPNGVLVGSEAVFDFAGALSIGSATFLVLEDNSIWSFDATTNLVPVDLAISGLEGLAIFDGAVISTNSDLRIVGGQLVQISNSSIDVSSVDGTQGGSLTISADQVYIDNSTISSTAFVNGNAGNISVFATTDLTITSSSLDSDSFGSGDAGYISLNSGELDIDGNILAGSNSTLSISDSFLTSSAIDAGNAGVILLAGNSIDVVDTYIASDAIAATPAAAAAGASAGYINISGENVTVEHSEIYSTTDTDNPNVDFPGVITITASDTINILDESVIATNTFGAAYAGQVELTAPVITINDSSIDSGTTSTGDAGYIGITATSLLTIADTDGVVENDRITSSSSGSGDAGYIVLQGGDINITNASITSDAFPDDFGPGSIGASAGYIEIKGDNIALTDSQVFADSSTDNSITAFTGQISLAATGAVDVSGTIIGTNTFGAGQAGQIILEAPVITISASSQIQSNTFAEGDAGTLFITGGAVTLTDSTISATSHDGASGAAGNIFVSGSSIALSNNANVDTTTYSPNAANAPANISLDATDNISLSGSVLNADTFGAADAGYVALNAPEISLENESFILSGSVGTATGNAGDIRLAGDSINISASELLSDAIGSTGNGGQISITAIKELKLSDKAKINSDTTSEGDAGNIQITTDILRITDSSITSESTGEFETAGISGFVDLDIGTVLNMQQATISTNSLYSQGGDILVTTKNSEIILNESTIEASAGANGNGGNIFLETDLLILEKSNILAKAEAGTGGFINIDGKLLDATVTPALRSQITVVQDFNSVISADSDTGTAGTVYIAAPNNDISAIVASQNADTLNAPQLASNRCDRSANKSSLTAKPTGSVHGVPGAHLSIGDDSAMNSNTTFTPMFSVACSDALAQMGEGNE